jgi:predicted acylesterase/phospholipase RssA
MTPPFSIVLAGGGCRAFWSLGVLEALGDDTTTTATEWAGVSAGAAMAVLFLTGSAREGVAHFEKLTAANPRNVYPGRLLSGERPFPHEAMYRTALAHGLQGGAFARLAAAPPLRILQAYIEAGQPRYVTAARALWAYRQQKRRGDLHGVDVPPRGLGWQAVTAQDLATPDELIEAILASSASPPITRSVEKAGRLLVDGGLVDNVPLRALSPAAQAGRVLVLLTRDRHAGQEPILHTADRLYLAPTRPTPVSKFDYTSPHLLRATFELGLADGTRWRDLVRAFVRDAGVPVR